MEYRNVINKAKKYNIQDSISQKTVLKRMLLGKCIYGVDIDHISVQIAMLGLWINTFIFLKRH